MTDDAKVRDHRDHVIVIAGASSATGRAVAERLTAEGALVVALGSDRGRLEAVPATDRIEVDLTDPVATEAVARGILSRHGRVDGLVHLVGGWSGGRSDEGWEALIRSSVTTLRSTTLALRDALVDSGDGRLAIISSTAVDAPTWSNANYVTAKAAAETWVRALARGWCASGAAAAVIFAVRAIGDGDGQTTTSVIAERMSGLWDLPTDELNGSRVVLA